MAMFRWRQAQRGARRPIWLTLALLVGLAALLGMGSSPRAAAAGPNLMTSTFSASQSSLSSNEQLTLTLTLKNTGDAKATANVTAQILADLNLVAGSITGGGKVEGSVITWSGIDVAANSSVALSYSVTPSASVSSAKTLTPGVAVQSNGGIFIRFTTITLVPGSDPAPSDLADSDKTASQQTLAFGEKLTYTITLRNKSSVNVTANVSDPLSDTRVDYVAGSASNGGSYNATSRTLSWNNLSVPANGSLALTFQVEPVVYVSAPSALVNIAEISSGGTTFSRAATVLLTMLPVDPPGEPDPVLGGSYKLAAAGSLKPNAQVAYTINVHNSSSAAITANVSDPLPAGLRYVAGSASNGGSYDTATRTLSWNNLNVAAGSDLALTFKVEQASPVSRATVVVNKATIASGDTTIERSGPLLLLPADATPPSSGRPTVESVQIGSDDVVSETATTLKIAAKGNPTKMYIQEWYLSTRPGPRWEQGKSSGWVDFATSYPWTLGSQSGTHFVVVWVADANKNISQVDRGAYDFVSLVTSSSVEKGGVVPYLVYFAAGVDVNAALTSASGDADLYVWYPGSRTRPDDASHLAGSDTVSFTTPRAGVYLFLVHGASAANYTLSINPDGGPRAPALADASTQANPAAFTSEPVLSRAGLDPLGVTETPSFIVQVHLPLVRR